MLVVFVADVSEPQWQPRRAFAVGQTHKSIGVTNYERRVAVLVGSLRDTSWSRKVARALIALALNPPRAGDRRDRSITALQPGL
jgi:hypothetical protein